MNLRAKKKLDVNEDELENETITVLVLPSVVDYPLGWIGLNLAAQKAPGAQCQEEKL